MKTVFTYIIVLIGLGCYGQTIEEVMTSAKSVMSKNFSMTVDYSSEYALNGKQLVDTERSKFVHFQNGYYQEIQDLILIKEDSVLMTIDHKEQVIALNYQFDQTDILQYLDIDQFDNEYFELSMEKGAKRYDITIKLLGQYSPITTLIVSYAKDTYVPLKVQILFSEDTKELYGSNELVISYSNFSFINGRGAHMSIEDYITLASGDIEVTDNRLNEYIKINNL